MTKEIIKISDIQLELSKAIITDKEVITKKIEQFKDLKKIVFDFSTKEGIEEAKKLKKEANAWVKDLKKFCTPLEEEGKSISDNRSLLTTTLVSGKGNVIDEILAPVKEREDKLSSIKDKLFIPSLSVESNNAKLEELDLIKDYDWLAFKDEALEIIERQKTFLTGERIKFIEEARLKKEAEEKAQAERDEAIRVEAQRKAKEEAQKAIDEANKQVEEAKNQIEEVKAKYLAPKPKSGNNEHKAKIHNEILADFLDIFEKMTEDQGKAVITLIAQGKIRNLTINY